jgi:hypothetical protein
VLQKNRQIDALTMQVAAWRPLIFFIIIKATPERAEFGDTCHCLERGKGA